MDMNDIDIDTRILSEKDWERCEDLHLVDFEEYKWELEWNQTSTLKIEELEYWI